LNSEKKTTLSNGKCSSRYVWPVNMAMLILSFLFINISSENSKQNEQMKQFTTFLSIILFVIVVISTLIVSFISIWIDIDPIVLEKLQSTILLTAIVLILSFVINQSIE
jgi:uncharacterized membrane protein (DUF485 family)